jgi:hypothetical protein
MYNQNLNLPNILIRAYYVNNDGFQGVICQETLEDAVKEGKEIPMEYSS